MRALVSYTPTCAQRGRCTGGAKGEREGGAKGEREGGTGGAKGEREGGTGGAKGEREGGKGPAALLVAFRLFLRLNKAILDEISIPKHFIFFLIPTSLGLYRA